MSLDKKEGHDVTKLDELDVDLIICGVRSDVNFNGIHDKKMVKEQNLDPYNNMQPKAGVKFNLMADKEEPKSDFITTDEFKKLHEMTKFMN